MSQNIDSGPGSIVLSCRNFRILFLSLLFTFCIIKFKPGPK